MVADIQAPEVDTRVAILKKNREKLMGYLANFQNDREDEQFAEEKAMLTRLLEQMGDDDAAPAQ